MAICWSRAWQSGKGHGTFMQLSQPKLVKLLKPVNMLQRCFYCSRAEEMVQGFRYENWTWLSQRQQHRHAHRWNS